MMFSLASYRYRHVLATEGGPIKGLETSEASVLGQRCFLANATLQPGLASAQDEVALYGQCHGSGVDASPMVARFKAISESLERWAHWQLFNAPERARYGFDVDPSSNGLAAFPGLRQRQARAGALLEASERFNVLHWWEGRLPALEADTPWSGIKSVTICSEAPGLTVILYKRTAAGFVVYGHAAAMDFDEACRKAAVELERHEVVIDRFALAHAGQVRGQLAEDAHPIERRCLFFASAEGHALFLDRVRSTPRHALATPKLVFDGPVPGPWTHYTDVWRVVYEPPNERFLSNDENYFYI